MGDILLALDIGTTAIKGAAFSADGEMLACSTGEYDLGKPAPDIVELDVEVYWQTTLKVLSEIVTSEEVDLNKITALGITGQAETLVTLDTEGKPLGKAIVWLDNRSKKEAAEIAEKFDVEKVFRITGQQEIVPTWTATKILWLRENSPEIFKKSHKYLMVEDYIAFRLTGNFATDRALNASTLYYNLETKDWWDEMLSFLEIGRGKLPELKNSGEDIGKTKADVCPLPSGIPVSIAAIDQIAGAVGAGNINSGTVTETTGSALALCATINKPFYDPEKRIGLYPHAIGDNYVLLPWAPTSGMILRWFRDNLSENFSYEKLDNLTENIKPGADGLIILPHFSGSLSPEFAPEAKGIFYGVDISHTRGNFVQAIFESIAFLLRDNLEILSDAGHSFEKIISLGGGARSKKWLQVKADVLQLPVEIMECEESTCLGAALLAGVGTGVFADAEEGVKNMCRIKDTIEPEKTNAVIYDAVFEKYRMLNKIILPTFGV